MQNRNKTILDLCGGTGSWSKPYKDAGYDVRIITLPWDDIFTYKPPANVYGILAAPTCAHFSQARTNAKKPRDLRTAMKLVIRCLEIIWECSYDLPEETSRNPLIKFWALENPKGILRHFLGKPALSFQPFDYGDRYQKPTDLWGKFNELKKNPIELTSEEKVVFGKNSQTLPKYKERNLFCLDGYEYNEGCGLEKRAVKRSITPEKFAKAFFKANL